MPKQTLRRQMLARRRLLCHSEWQEASRLAQLNLLALLEYSRASCVALYSPLQNETDTALVRETALSEGRRVLYPVVVGHEMLFRQIDTADMLRHGKFGILEPCGMGVDHLADEADLIVVPGVAFDCRGHRIGFGKGFYDRFLKHPGLKAVLVGFCHDFQLIEGEIAADPHDVRMDIVVTGSRVVRC